MLGKERSRIRVVQMDNLRGWIVKEGLDERIEGVLRRSVIVLSRQSVRENAGSRSVGRPRKR